METSIAVAVGSSTQAIVFVLPLMVVVGWALGVPMSLDFHAFETGVVFSTVLTTVVMIHDGQSNWLKGVTLVTAYAVLSVAFMYHADPATTGASKGRVL